MTNVDELKSKIRESVVKIWAESDTELSATEICSKFGIDIESNERNKLFWNILVSRNLNERINFDERVFQLLDHELTHQQRKTSIEKILADNPHIKCREVSFMSNEYYYIYYNDFESILMLLGNTPGLQESKEIFSIIKLIAKKYDEYKAECARMIKERNEILSFQIEEKKERIEKLSSQIKENIDILNNKIAPKISPDPVVHSKRRDIGLYRTPNKDRSEWYLMRRQSGGWEEAEKRLLKKGMRPIETWQDVPHAVDYGNRIKEYFWHKKGWSAHGNIIYYDPIQNRAQNDWFIEDEDMTDSDIEDEDMTDPDIEDKGMTDSDMVATIESIFARKNRAQILADQNSRILGENSVDEVDSSRFKWIDGF